MKKTRQQIIDQKYLIFIENKEEFNTLKKNGFELTGKYFGAYCYSESDNSYDSDSTKTFKGTYKPEIFQDKILTINDIELARFPFKLTEENFVKLVKAAPKVYKRELCELFTPRIFTDTFVMIRERYYNLMRKGFDENGQKVLDEIFGADVIEKPFPKFMKSKEYGTIVLFSKSEVGKVIKAASNYHLDYQSDVWDMICFEDVEIEIIEKN